MNGIEPHATRHYQRKMMQSTLLSTSCGHTNCSSINIRKRCFGGSKCLHNLGFNVLIDRADYNSTKSSHMRLVITDLQLPCLSVRIANRIVMAMIR